MKLQPSINPVIFNAQSTQDDVLSYFLWTKGWKIQVSSGLQVPLGSLLSDIQDILGSELNLSFLRIVEGQKSSEFFIRKLRVFIEPNDTNTAKNAAIKYAITKAIIASEEVCHRCGDSFHDDIPINNDYLEYYASMHNIEEYHMQFMKVCARCINSTCEGHVSELLGDDIASIEKQESAEAQLQNETKLPEAATDTSTEEKQEKESAKATEEELNNKKSNDKSGQKIILYDRKALKKLEENYGSFEK